MKPAREQEVARPPLEALGAAAIARARAEAARERRSWIEVLEEQSGLAGDALVAALAAAVRMPWLDIGALNRLEPAWDVLPLAQAAKRCCLVLRDAGGALTAVLADPLDAELRAWCDEHACQARDGASRPLAWALAGRGDLAALVARHEEGARAMDSVLAESGGAARGDAHVEDLSLARISEDASPVVRAVNSTLHDALKAAASDIHLETAAGALAIKYRIDGVLTHVGAIAGAEMAEQVISRIKVMSELDIAERRVPQDGRFKVALRGREIDVRVSVMPSIFGEDAVLRILDKQSLSDELRGLRLDSLGFDAESMAHIRRLAAEPYGMLLVTGPTGSGKTTTLYAALTEINHGQDKIITIEDPVEYQLPGVLQIPVNEKKGLTFARGLRSILRHDPDKIMVGEIRDGETAQIAIQAALTGHLVFTTVHANNVFDVIGRFAHMGVDPYSFVSALNGIVAQRLVRLNCTHCALEVRPDAALLETSGLDAAAVAGYGFRAGTGCGQCRGTGFRGRRAIAELLTLDDELRELITARAPVRAIKDAARRRGTRFLREAALALVARGETSLQEINRVTFVAG
jgi:general secretion pathway protein E